MNATSHVAQNTNGRSSATDGRTTRYAGYAQSQRIRKPIEKTFDGIKTTDGRERIKVRSRERVGWAFSFAAVAYKTGAVAEASGGRMNAPANCRLIGGWRIIGADLWNRAHLDLCDPAALTIIAEARLDHSVPPIRSACRWPRSSRRRRRRRRDSQRRMSRSRGGPLSLSL